MRKQPLLLDMDRYSHSYQQLPFSSKIVISLWLWSKDSFVLDHLGPKLQRF